MHDAGFERVTASVAERVVDIKRGREILSSPFLPQGSCSQLALLSGEAYAVGLEGIKNAVTRAEKRGEALTFRTDISLHIVTGHKPT
jgi:hypothetical protein